MNPSGAFNGWTLLCLCAYVVGIWQVAKWGKR